MITVEMIKEEGNRAFANKEYKKAAKIYRDALNFTPDNPILYANRAQCFLYLKDWKRALEDTQQGLSFSPELNTRIKLLLRRAIAQRKTEDLPGATESLKELLLLDPNNVSATNELTYIQGLTPTNKKPKFAANVSKANGPIKIAVEEADTLPEEFKKYLQVSGSPQKEALPKAAPEQPFDKLNEAIDDLFKLKKSTIQPKLPTPPVASPSTDFSDRPSMHFLSHLVSLPPAKKVRAYTYVVNLETEYYKDLFAEGGIEWEFLNFFFEAAAYISSHEPTSHWDIKVLNHLKTFTLLRRYDLSFQFCMENNIQTLATNTTNLDDATRLEYKNILGV